jgi:hypothetical protein
MKMTKKSTKKVKDCIVIEDSESVLKLNLDGDYTDNILDLEQEQDGLVFDFEGDSDEFDNVFEFNPETE